MISVISLSIGVLMSIGIRPVNAWSQIPNSNTETNTAATAPSTASGKDPQINRRELLQKSAITTGISFFTVPSKAQATLPESAYAKVEKKRDDEKGKGKGRIYQPPPGSMTGKLVVVTGATSGLGLESAKRLAAAGAAVVVTGRTVEKGDTALGKVRSYLEETSVSQTVDGFVGGLYALSLNLDDFDSVRSFPQRYESILGSRKIDVLINNAGVAAIPTRELTNDGFERTFQSNHLGPFLLTALLFPYLNRNGTRIINVSSQAHVIDSSLNLNNLNGEQRYDSSGWTAYGRSKLENILFTQELQKRADRNGLDWCTVVSLHPGVVGTDIWRSTYAGLDRRGGTGTNKAINENPSFLQSKVSNLFYQRILTSEEGANAQIWLAAGGEDKETVVKGQYFDYDKGRWGVVEDYARDEVAARKLWEISQEMTGVVFDVK